MNGWAGLIGMLQAVEETRIPLGWFEAPGWSRVAHLLLVAGASLAILGAVHLVSRAVRRAVDDGNDSVTSDAERRAETLGSVLTNAARVLVIGFFLLMTLQEFGVNIGPLVAGAGVAGVALGFGAQSLVKDVISGFFLLMENQFGVGDIISVDDKHIGTVERIPCASLSCGTWRAGPTTCPTAPSCAWWCCQRTSPGPWWRWRWATTPIRTGPSRCCWRSAAASTRTDRTWPWSPWR